MTPTDIKRLRELCEKATPGPWVWTKKETTSHEEMVEHLRGHIGYGSTDGLHGVGCPEHVLSSPTVDGVNYEHMVEAAITGNGPMSAENAQFIAAARTALPALLDEVERLYKDFDIQTEKWMDEYGAHLETKKEVERLQAIESAAKAWATQDLNLVGCTQAEIIGFFNRILRGEKP